VIDASIVPLEQHDAVMGSITPQIRRTIGYLRNLEADLIPIKGDRRIQVCSPKGDMTDLSDSHPVTIAIVTNPGLRWSLTKGSKLLCGADLAVFNWIP